MVTKPFLTALCCAALVGLTGCSTSPIIRGQSPMPVSMSHGHAHGAGSRPTCDFSQSAMPCPPQGACPSPNCGPGCNLPFHPVHRNFYTYDHPQNLMYPNDNTPAATVQYPYYTHRGPTDFFMK